jgi:hypothetical protein
MEPGQGKPVAGAGNPQYEFLIETHRPESYFGKMMHLFFHTVKAYFAPVFHRLSPF